MATDPGRLPAKFAEALENADRKFVSHASALEIQLKHRKDRKSFPFSLRELERSMAAFDCRELPISYQDIAALDGMRFLHKDPFDRLLMAQASRRELSLATFDDNVLRTAQRYRAFSPFRLALLERQT